MAKISSLKEIFKEILGAVLRGSSFIQIYLKEHRLGKSPIFLVPLAIVTNLFAEQIADGQFRSDLDAMESEFSNLRDNFKDAIASQVAIGMSPNAP